MANAETCAVLCFLVLLSSPLASAIGHPRHGRPNPNNDGFFGMPWFGGGAPGGAAGFFGGGAPGRAAGFFGGGAPGGPAGFFGGGAPGGPAGFFGGRGGGGAGAGFGSGWGAGGTWYRRGAVTLPSTVCAERGPCHGKRLTCPARCFRSYSYSNKNGGGGGGGGGCSFDCTKRCAATC